MAFPQQIPFSQMELTHGSNLDRSLYNTDISGPTAVIDLAAARRDYQRMLDVYQDSDLVKVVTGQQHFRGEPGKAIPLQINVIVDDPEQLQLLRNFKESWGGLIPNVHIKINMGSNQASGRHCNDRCNEVADAVVDAHERGDIVLSGLYAYTPHAMYETKGGTKDKLCEAMCYLAEQYDLMTFAANTILKRAEDKGVALDHKPLVLSASVECAGVLEALNEAEKGETNAYDDNSPLHNKAALLLWNLRSIGSSGYLKPEIHYGSYYASSLPCPRTYRL
ncbi:hypothetical protein VM1G_02125 [Cytospora mali]|uniref:Uncharacterized protein n=1 Tax=Cytospora mali TaxID=578113 RepID=A0A194VP89_CYTMA|nr:hypothetical protein VM1G_02125 [Valsa mali]